MIYGMTPAQYEILDRLVVAPLKSQGAEVYLFGSRAMGRHHPFSDVDLLYRCDVALPAGFLSEIKEAIEESRFPFKVDLVADQDLAASYRSSVESQLKRL